MWKAHSRRFSGAWSGVHARGRHPRRREDPFASSPGPVDNLTRQLTSELEWMSPKFAAAQACKGGSWCGAKTSQSLKVQ